MADSKSNTVIVNAWGLKNPTATSVISATPLSEVMSEELAKDLQSKYTVLPCPVHTVTVSLMSVFYYCREELMLRGASDAIAAGDFDDCSSINLQETTNDKMLAEMLQLQFDQEYDRALRKEEAKYNGKSKGSTYLMISMKA